MAHQIEINKVTGKASMFYVGEVPWHSLGTRLYSPPTIEEAIKAAGLDWTVSTHPSTSQVYKDGQLVANIPCNMRTIIRDSDLRKLSEVGPRFQPLQNEDAFKWFQPFLDSGECSLEAAGSLFEGKKIWVLAKLNKEPMEILPGDEVRKYLMLFNCHSDERSVSASLSPIRSICNNTISAAFSNKATRLLRAKHTSKIKVNLEAIRDTINIANAEFEATAEQYKLLAKKQINKKDLAKYIKLVFKPKKEEAEEVVENEEVKEQNESDSRLIENKIIALFESGKGTEIPGVRGSAWGMYNTVSEYLTWFGGRTQDAILDKLWAGQNAKLNAHALQIAVELVKSI